MSSRTHIATALLLSLAALTRAADDPAYPITLHRPDKPGDTIDHRTLVQFDQKVTQTPAGGPSMPTQESHIKAYLMYRGKVVAVDKLGSPTEVLMTVDKILLNGDEKSVVEPGTTIEVKRTDKTSTFTTSGGQTLPPDVLTILRFQFPPLNTSGLSDDEIYGTKTPRRAGDSWTVDPALAVKLAAANLVIDPANFSGKVTLTHVESPGDNPLLELEFLVTFSDAQLINVPEGTKARTGKSTSKFTTLLPVDPRQQPLDFDRSADTYIIQQSRDGSTTTIERHIHSKTAASPVTPVAP